MDRLIVRATMGQRPKHVVAVLDLGHTTGATGRPLLLYRSCGSHEACLTS
jgi:hypothetical protein